MNAPRKNPAIGAVIYFSVIFSLAIYFTFASVQGNFGLFRQVQIDAEAELLTLERDRLELAVGQIRNKTRRLSDEFLDLDLLDQQARDVLGLVRTDEMVIR